MAVTGIRGAAAATNLRPTFRLRLDPTKTRRLSGRLRKSADVVLDASERAMNRITKSIKKRSQELVPYKTGNLHDAAFAKVTRSRNIVDGTVGYRSSKAPYAFLQHETPPPPPAYSKDNPTFRHTAPTKWKFLQQPLMEHADDLREVTARAVRRRLKFISRFM